MKKKIYSLIICAMIMAPVFSQTAHKVFFKPLHKDQSWTVPAGVTQIQVKLWGAGGAGGNYVFNDKGGGGGFATAILSVTPGEQLTVIVGSGGLPSAGAGAYGGGGAKACGVGGRGGGRSAIRNATGTELITAGAGGGGGGVAQDYETGGHGGGGLSGEPDAWLPYGGGAGTQTAGGIGGRRKATDPNPNAGPGEPGGMFFGGKANCYDNGYNGSGGGGYYGGGSGTDYGDGAGGAGSSFVPDGGSTIAATSDIPGNISDPDYKGRIGYGGQKAKPGMCGLVVIIYSDNNLISTQNENIAVAGTEKFNKSIAYPNPAKNTVTINFTASKNGTYIFEMIDLGGKVLLRKEINATQGINHTTIDVSRFAKGSYFITITRPDKTKESIQVHKE